MSTKVTTTATLNSLTEDDACKKQCPVSKNITHDDSTKMTDITKCIGSKCMGWVFDIKTISTEELSHISPPKVTHKTELLSTGTCKFVRS